MDEVTKQGETIEVPAIGNEWDVSAMVTSIVKSLSGSRQLADVSETAGVSHGELTVEPPIDPGSMWGLYELNAYHAACIGAKVTDSLGRGWSIYDTEGDEEDLETTRVARQRLDELAVGGWTFGRLALETGREFEAIGYGILEVARDDSGAIIGLIPAAAQTFRVSKIQTNESGEIVESGGSLGRIWMQKRNEKARYFVRYSPNREKQPEIDYRDGSPLGEGGEQYRATEVLPILFPSPRTMLYGVPDWVSASGAIAELALIRSYNEAFFDSNGMIDQIIQVRAPTVKQATQLKDEIVRQFSDAKGRQHINVFVGSDDQTEIIIEPLSQKAKTGDADRGFDDGTERLVKEVLIGHQVPPYRVGWAEVGSLGGSAAKEMLEAYRFGVIEPRQGVFQAAFSELFEDDSLADLMPEGRELRFADVDWDAFERDLEMANDGVDRGAINRDEWRAALGFEPTGRPEMQEFLIGDKPVGSADAEDMLAAFQDAMRQNGGRTGEEPEDEGDMTEREPPGEA